MLRSPIDRLRSFTEEVPPSVLFIDNLSQFVGLMVFTRAKGKDKLSAFAQNFAKVAASIAGLAKVQNVWGAVEANISTSRKIFKLFKYFPEVSKCRRALQHTRTQKGLTKIRSYLEAMGRAVACIYYIYDNAIWASAMGLLHSNKLPGHLRFLQFSVRPKDGLVVSLLGGSSALHRRKDYLSMYRIYMAFVSKVAFVVQYYADGEVASRDELLAQAWDLLALTCNLGMLRQRIYGGWLGNAALGLLGMTASFASVAEMYYEKWRRGPKPCGSLGVCKICHEKMK